MFNNVLLLVLARLYLFTLSGARAKSPVVPFKK